MSSKNKDNKLVRNAVKKAIKDKNIENTIKDQKWEDLDEMYLGLSKGLVEMGQYLHACLDITGVTEYVSDKVRLDTLVKCVTSDIVKFSKDLAEIKKQHLNNKGPIKDENELFKCITIFQQYQDFETKLFSVVTPVHMEALVMLNEANELMKKDIKGNKDKENNTSEDIEESSKVDKEETSDVSKNNLKESSDD